MHQRAGVALARAHPEPRKLVAQQRAIVLSVLSQALHGKLLKLAGLLKKVIDAHCVSALWGINWSASMVDANCGIACDACHDSGYGARDWVSLS